MAERVYPSQKPNPPRPVNGATGNGGNPPFAPTKAQLYGASRPAYRPQPPKQRRRSQRSCCCSCCLWLTLVVVALVLLAAIAGGIFYVLYRPHHPAFTVSSLRLSKLNVTSNQLTSKLDLAITARNPNRKLVYVYEPTSISVSSNGVAIGDGSFPAFVQDTKNTTVLRSTVSTLGASLDASAASDLKKQTSLPLEIDLDTKAGVKIGGFKTKKIRIKVSCIGINVAVPKGKPAPASSSPDVSCKVKLRIKIWKWTF